MTRRKIFASEAEARAFSSAIDNLLDCQYKRTGRNARTGEAVFEWVVEWDEPTFDELYPARPIEM